MMNDTLVGCEYCVPDDDGFTDAQRAAIRATIRRHPKFYVWIGIGEAESDFVVGYCLDVIRAQERITLLSDTHRVWLVQTGRKREVDQYAGR